MSPTVAAETSAEKEPEPPPTESADKHSAPDVSIDPQPTSRNEHTGGTGDFSVTRDATTPAPVADIDQLQLDGLAAISERFPTLTPSTAAARVDQSNPASSGVPRSRRQSRIAMYVVVAALALIVVAGVAYFAGRSAQATTTPTGQLP
jgi:hypothetical protein